MIGALEETDGTPAELIATVERQLTRLRS